MKGPWFRVHSMSPAFPGRIAFDRYMLYVPGVQGHARFVAASGARSFRLLFVRHLATGQDQQFRVFGFIGGRFSFLCLGFACVCASCS